MNGSATESIAADKKLGIFDKIFSAYHDARSCIRNDLVRNFFVLLVIFCTIYLVLEIWYTMLTVFFN